MVCVVFTCQISRPLGATTVMLGTGVLVIEKVALLSSRTAVLARLIIRIRAAVVVGPVTDH